MEMEGRFGGDSGCVFRSLPPRLAILQFLEEMRVLEERVVGVMLILGWHVKTIHNYGSHKMSEITIVPF